jgi:hypothetical protein
MRTGVGIHIDTAEIHAVVVQNRKLSHQWSCARVGEPLESTLRGFFDAVPRRVWRRANFTFVLGGQSVQCKRITGLPALPEADLHRLVAENAARFFLGETAKRRYVVARHESDVIAEAFDGPNVDAIAAVLTRHHVRRARIVSDTSVHGVPSRETGDTSAGNEAAARAAHKAVALDRSAPALQVVCSSGVVSPRRHRAGVIALVFALVLAAVAPTASAHLTTRRASTEMANLSASYTRAVQELQERDDAIRELAFLHGFRFASSLRTLAVLAMVLPDRAAIVALVADSLGAAMTVVAHAVPEVLAALDTTSLLAGAQLDGPITRERLGDEERDRSTVRFAWANRP